MDYENPIIKMIVKFAESNSKETKKRQGEYSRKEVEQAKAVVEEILKYEKENPLDTLDNQLNFFYFLVDLAEKNQAKSGYIGKLILVKWSKKSKNKYAAAYKIGLTHGHIDGSANTQKRLEARRSKKLSQAALKMHAENHAMKRDVFNWLDSNMKDFKSMDGAAQAIAGKVAPVAFRTARTWVGEWKKLRYASKA